MFVCESGAALLMVDEIIEIMTQRPTVAVASPGFEVKQSMTLISDLLGDVLVVQHDYVIRLSLFIFLPKTTSKNGRPTTRTATEAEKLKCEESLILVSFII